MKTSSQNSGGTTDASTYKSRRSKGSTGVSKVVKSVSEVFVLLNNQKRFKFDSSLWTLLEVVSLLQFMLATMYGLFDTHKEASVIMKYVLVLLFPGDVKLPFVFYTVFFIMGASCVLLLTTLLVYLGSFRISNNTVSIVVPILLRLVRTVLFIPLSSVFLAPLNCDFFGGTFSVATSPSESCVEFPYLLFLILGIVLVANMVVLSVVDVLFCQDKFKGIGLWTSSPQVRFPLCMLGIQILVTFFYVVLIKFEIAWVDYSGYGSIIGCLVLMLIVLIRYVPFFNFQFVFIIATLYVSSLLVVVCSLIVLLTHQFVFLSVLGSVLIALPLIWTLLVLRYFAMWKHFQKKRIEVNFWICQTAIDVAIGLFNKQRLVRFLRKKISPKGSVEHRVQMTHVITDLLSNEAFDKTKNLCQMLISLCIKKNVSLAKSILNHTDTIIKKGSIDVEFSLSVFRNTIRNIQNAGTNSRKKNVFEVENELRLVQEKENELQSLYCFLFKYGNSTLTIFYIVN
jgi:hypothetical protein